MASARQGFVAYRKFCLAPVLATSYCAVSSADYFRLLSHSRARLSAVTALARATATKPWKKRASWLLQHEHNLQLTRVEEDKSSWKANNIATFMCSVIRVSTVVQVHFCAINSHVLTEVTLIIKEFFVGKHLVLLSERTNKMRSSVLV